MNRDRFSKIPSYRQIRILHEDAFIVVIDKPCNLRSVPGIAAGSKRPRESQLTSQEAWLRALQFFQNDNNKHSKNEITYWAHRLTTSSSLASIPRKQNVFIRYWERNQTRLLQDGEPKLSKADLSQLAIQVHVILSEQQKIFMNLPPATELEDSAYGQLVLLGYDSLYVVHRLDCETSGVMLFARTQDAASYFGFKWRERTQITKLYVARVTRWPPYTSILPSQSEGRIDLPLAPDFNDNKGLRWHAVATNNDNGKDGSINCQSTSKPSSTLWYLRNVEENGTLVLNLQPLTGRTHQLRIHLAEIGSGIVGDTLYGEHSLTRPSESNNDTDENKRLYLHAEKLSFPHPQTGELVQFHAEIPW
jgi:tRNA pseudouridine32 synthase / 23S rRNA pseudouridine746 synthase